MLGHCRKHNLCQSCVNSYPSRIYQSTYLWIDVQDVITTVLLCLSGTVLLCKQFTLRSILDQTLFSLCLCLFHWEFPPLHSSLQNLFLNSDKQCSRPLRPYTKFITFQVIKIEKTVGVMPGLNKTNHCRKCIAPQTKV